MKASELRNLTQEELIQKNSALKQELFNLRFEARAGRIEKPSRIRQAKRDIARINTILNSRVKEETK